MLQRNPNSHKGDNGKVMVIGGNEMFHGAPLLAALAAEQAGADLVYLWLPSCHAQVARTYSLNLIVHTFQETHLSPADVKTLLHFAEQTDVVVIGPGLGSHPDTQKAIKTFLTELQVPAVVDASALLRITQFPKGSVLTPHRGEFTALTGEEPEPAHVQKWAKEFGVTIVCKGPKDIISDGKDVALNETGNALMSVGGTGDALAGFIGGLMAQHVPAFEAAELATRLWGLAGDERAKTHASLRAEDLLPIIPEMLFKNA